MKYIPLEHWNNRDEKIDMLVLHCSALSVKKMINVLNEAQLSSHYIIGERGSVVCCVNEDKRAWHAGKSFWRGCENINSRSIGIELCSKTLGQEKYGKKQMEALIALCRDIIKKYNIPACNVVGHSDIAPKRKADPGKSFPWEQLAKKGIGIWYDIKNAKKVKTDNIAELLALIGYDTENEASVEASAYAFCRHFAPQYVYKDEDVLHLVENVLPNDFSFMQENEFLQTLKAVAYSYSK